MSAPRPPFAGLVRELRRAGGLTQEELAVRAGVGVRILRDIEAGRALRPQRSTVDLLADALGLGGEDRARFIGAARGRPGAAVHLRPIPPLVGRADDLAALATLLEVADLITLVGLSGVGKASVAISVGHRVADRFPGGVGGVSVTEAAIDAEVLACVVSVFNAARLDDLAVRFAVEPALLVLIGVDRNPDAAVAAIGWLRAHAPRLRILATSRHPLGLPGEHEWALAPLDVPPPTATGAEVFAYPATVLFLQRLRLVRQRPVDVSEAATLGALVRRLGGLPLALELAAARGRVLELDEMLSRSVAPAQRESVEQSVREAVLASWRLLVGAERACLCWLSVFQWRWSVDLAEELLAPALAGADVVAVVDRLVGLGLVAVRADGPEMRFWLPDAVGAVAVQEARALSLLTPARDRHAAMMARLAAQTVAELGGPNGAAAARRMGYLLADVQAALDHLHGRPSVDNQIDVAELRADLATWLERRGL